MKNFILTLAKTPAFAFSGLMGIIGSIQYITSYDASTDKSNGVAFWLCIVALILSAGYLGLFLFVRFTNQSEAKEGKG